MAQKRSKLGPPIEKLQDFQVLLHFYQQVLDLSYWKRRKKKILVRIWSNQGFTRFLTKLQETEVEFDL